MAIGEYRGVNGVARKITKEYRGVEGVARKIVKAYRGVNGIARKYFGGVSIFLLSSFFYVGKNNATYAPDVHATVVASEQKFDMRVYVTNSSTSIDEGYVSYSICSIIQNSENFVFAGKTLSLTAAVSGLASYRDFYVQMIAATGMVRSHRIYSSGSYTYTIPANVTEIRFYLTNCATGTVDTTAVLTNVAIDEISVFSDTTII